ncbi:D-2-hydroxyacid dehydrogenase [Paenibacillus thalictri]|uniref:D-2-hydroxyacid dehydrogenase n=1 Tax=Paenibacillus thalictri TaxID=2527873 RepID=A0A4Q9E023_9BACL|nr:D-2-hydroxyacid dehydrogenase [Paenibacillus thalictri]TBL81558.1 D-2-hydroxyacid dehydrogenase [Paenibacillus thalictri]
MKIVVLDGYTLNPGDLDWNVFEGFGELEVYERTSPDQLLDRARGAEILLSNKTVIGENALDQLPGLQYIGVLATGYNVIDVNAAAKRGIVVSNIPSYGTSSVAQFTFALLLELCHRAGLHSDAVRDGEWGRSADWCFTKSSLIELSGKTLGIIGFGLIGQQTARIAQAFGMRIAVPDRGKPLPAEFGDARALSMERLFAESDVLSLHCPLTADTKGIVNRDTLRLMKKSALLVNTARGPLINDQDLADALNEGIIAGAALDVLSEEPPRTANPLIGARNCLITPHIAWSTREARTRLMETAADNVNCFLQGKPQNVVSPAL